MQPFEPSDGYLALRKLMATMVRMPDKIKSVYAFSASKSFNEHVIICGA
jgi:hypothetical protein